MKKGLIYGFEAMLGGLIIMLYTTTLLSDVFDFKRTDELEVLYRKSLLSFEYALSLNTDTVAFISYDEQNLLPLFRYFLSPINVYDIYMYNKPPSRPQIGIYKQLKDSYITHYLYHDPLQNEACLNKIVAPSLVVSGSVECKEGVLRLSESRKIKYLLINLPVGEKDQYFVTFDWNNDGIYQTLALEGPFVEKSIVEDPITTQKYFIDLLTELNRTFFLYKINNEEIRFMRFMEENLNYTINGIRFAPVFSFFNAITPLHENNVLFINTTLNTTMIGNLIEYFYDGGNIILTKNANASNFLESLGFDNSSWFYDIVDASMQNQIMIDTEKMHLYGEKLAVKTYYNGINLSLKLIEDIPPGCGGVDVTLYESIYHTYLNLSQPYAILILSPLDGGTQILVDRDGDCDFADTPDNAPLYEGDVFLLENVRFIIEKITPEHIKVKIDNIYGGNYSHTLNGGVYLIRNSQMEFFYLTRLTGRELKLKGNDIDIGDSISVPLSQDPLNPNVWHGTLSINENHTYEIIIAKEGDKQFMYLDRDPEIKYSPGDIIRFEVETYIVSFDINSENIVRFILAERDNVPISVSLRNKRGGDVMYIHSDLNTTIEKSLLYALMFYVLNNERYPLYISRKEAESTGVVAYPLKIGLENQSAIIGIRRYIE